MKIAVPTEEGIVEEHFEGCVRFALYTLDSDYSVETVEEFTAPDQGAPVAEVCTELMKHGVTHVLAMRVQTDTIHMLHARRICVVRGAQGNVKEVVESFAIGDLIDSPLPDDTSENSRCR
jgi:predicted Fe-Mo cluster-binding NifX family protein